jgi:hypothetical protein
MGKVSLYKHKNVELFCNRVAITLLQLASGAVARGLPLPSCNWPVELLPEGCHYPPAVGQWSCCQRVALTLLKLVVELLLKSCLIDMQHIYNTSGKLQV